MDFQERLQWLLHEKRLTQKKLSELTGIDQNTISRWKKASKPPRGDSLLKIQEATGCSLDWLQRGEGNPFPGKVTAKQRHHQNSPHMEGDGTMVTSQGGQAANAGDSGLVVQIPEGYKATIIDDPGAGASGNMISIYTEKEKVFWAKFREYGNQALLDGFIRKLDQMRDFTKEE